MIVINVAFTHRQPTKITETGFSVYPFKTGYATGRKSITHFRTAPFVICSILGFRVKINVEFPCQVMDFLIIITQADRN